jgi:diamine N-acetyltransferase
MYKLNISLRNVTQQNYEAICDLDVLPEQEQYVACNMWGLVEAAYNPGHVCRAIYLDDTPVGFFMWVYETAQKVSVWRFMVDHRYQRQGLGRKAMKLALTEIKQDQNLKEIEICYQPDNPVANPFYESFGFKVIGMDEDDEDMLAIIALQDLMSKQ